jgi:hypothetical protein
VFLGTQDKVDLCQEIWNRIWIHDQVIELYTCLQRVADVDSGSGVDGGLPWERYRSSNRSFWIQSPFTTVASSEKIKVMWIWDSIRPKADPKQGSWRYPECRIDFTARRISGHHLTIEECNPKLLCPPFSLVVVQHKDAQLSSSVMTQVLPLFLLSLLIIFSLLLCPFFCLYSR